MKFSLINFGKIFGRITGQINTFERKCQWNVRLVVQIFIGSNPGNTLLVQAMYKKGDWKLQANKMYGELKALPI